MSRSLIPVNIRQHLIPFLYQEFEGIEAQYLTRKVKAAKVSTQTVFGKTIRLLAEKAELPHKAQSYNVFLSVRDVESSDFFGHVYKYQSGKNCFLRLPESGAQLVNDYLEDVFRLSLISFVLGYSTNNNFGDINKAIHLFLDQYNLREYGFSEPTLRQYYNRELRRNSKLGRLQRKFSTNYLNH